MDVASSGVCCCFMRDFVLCEELFGMKCVVCMMYHIQSIFAHEELTF